MTRRPPRAAHLSRRRFVQLASGLLAPAAAVGGAGLLAPALAPPARAAVSASERQFLFVFVRGGWDTTYAFTPMLDNPDAAQEQGAVLAEAHGVPFVDHESRPSLRTFFETYADRMALLNGFEVRSVTHERCRRILMTGASESGFDDWPSLLAGRSTQDLLFPHLVISGPNYTDAYTSSVVRVGDEGQLPELLDGSALERSEIPVEAPSSDLEALEDAFVRGRVEAQLDAAGRGQESRFSELYGAMLDQIDAIGGLTEQIELSPGDAGCSRDLANDGAAALDCLEMGITRCAMIQHNGWCDSSWDTHEANDGQAIHYEELFGYLLTLFADLEGRGDLMERLTVVVVSEMGRHPQLNSWGGKDHWTFTSAMLLGSGVRGGQVIGGLGEDGQGRPVDLSSGGISDSGTALTAAHLGATLLAMGDVDPGPYAPGGAPIEALFS